MRFPSLLGVAEQYSDILMFSGTPFDAEELSPLSFYPLLDVYFLDFAFNSIPWVYYLTCEPYSKGLSF